MLLANRSCIMLLATRSTTPNGSFILPRSYKYEQERKLLQRNQVSKVIAETNADARVEQ